MIKEMIVSSTALETKIAILEDDQLAELYIERNRSRGILGNIYKGRVTKVLPGMQSAFVNVGLEKDSFLYVSDFIEDTEEYDKVLTEAEEKVATALAEIEVQERPAVLPRRDQRPDRRKWRDKKERSESSRAVSAQPVALLPAAEIIEKWMLTAETESGTSPEELVRGAEIPDLPHLVVSFPKRRREIPRLPFLRRPMWRELPVLKPKEQILHSSLRRRLQRTLPWIPPSSKKMRKSPYLLWTERIKRADLAYAAVPPQDASVTPLPTEIAAPITSP